jgi:serine/threonine protein kinase
VDGRSDVFSLGVVFYEMLSGKPPFLDNTPMDTLAAVLNREPVTYLPGVGAALDRAVRQRMPHSPTSSCDSTGSGRSPSGSSARRCRSTPGTCSRASGTECFSPAAVDRRKRCAS